MGRKDAASLSTNQEVEEGGSFFAPLGLIDDDADLAQGAVEVVRDKDAATVKDEGVGDKADVGVAGVGELEGLTDVLGEDELVLKLGPEAGFLQSFLGGATVGGVEGVGERDVSGAGKVAQVFELTGLRPNGETSDGVDLARVRIDFVALEKGVELGFVGGEEEVEGGAVFDLAGEHAGGAEGEGDFAGELILPEGEERGKVGGSGDEEGILGAKT